MLRYLFRTRESDVEIYLVLHGDVLSCPVVRSESVVDGCAPGEGIFDIPGCEGLYFCMGYTPFKYLCPEDRGAAERAAIEDGHGRPCFVVEAKHRQVPMPAIKITTPEFLPENQEGPFIEEEFV